MITLLLIGHIALMSASLLVTSLTLLLAIFSFHVPRRVQLANIIGTSGGLAAGTVLLLHHPLDYRCLVLSGYLAAFVAIQLFIRRQSRSLSKQTS